MTKITRLQSGLSRLLGMAASAALVLGGMTWAGAAQDPGQGGPPPGGPGGGFGGGPGGGGFRGGGRFGQQQRQQPTILDVPVAVLTQRLNLTAEQGQKITASASRAQQQAQELMPFRRGGQDGQQGQQQQPQQQRPDRETMRANIEKLMTARQEAVREAEAVLTEEQRQALPAVLKEVQAFRFAGIPMDLTPKLNLTTNQTSQIVQIGQSAERQIAQRTAAAGQQGGDFRANFETMRQVRESAQKKAMAVLTAEQRALVEEHQKANPSPWGGGGPGGFGGRGGGRGGSGGGAGGPAAGGPQPQM